MKQHSLRHHILSYCSGSALLVVMAVSAGQAGADIRISGSFPTSAGECPLPKYDAFGRPIWGHGPGGRPIYAYTPEGIPVYIFTGICRGYRVPPWIPKPRCYGPAWPEGVRRGCPPRRPRYGRPYPPPPLFRRHP